MQVYKKCFEVLPSFLKGQRKTFNPFERIFKNFIYNEWNDLSSDSVKFSKENFDKMVENYYIYKKQFKKYGLTFNVNEEYEEKGSYLSKIFFISENYERKNNNDEIKILYKGKDYYLIYNFCIDKTYKEKDNKAYFDLRF